MKKLLALCLALCLVLSLAACGQSAKETQSADAPAADAPTADAPAQETLKIRVAASPTPHAEILAVAKEILAQEGIELEIVEYDDYVQPNLVVDSGELDANYFQHSPYLESFNAENGTQIVSVALIHYEPFGIYAGKCASLEELPDGAEIIVPNDGSNETRALLLLQQEGLIKLNEGIDASSNATIFDIAENPKNLKITEMDAAQLARAREDVDLAVINGNYALAAGLSAVEDALAIEDASGDAAQTYANLLGVKAGRENDPAIQALVKALQSDAVRDYINENYGGAVVPIF